MIDLLYWFYSTTQASNQETNENQSTISSHLHNHLTALRNLREGFIEQHGAEPSVSFRYSQQSTSNSTISLKVATNQPTTASTSNASAPSTSTSGNDIPQSESMVSVKHFNWSCQIINLEPCCDHYVVIVEETEI